MTKFLNPQAACTAVAVMRHFFHTAVFTWMLVEAVNLFIKLVKVISTKTFYMTYLAIGWGRLKVFSSSEIIRKIIIEIDVLKKDTYRIGQFRLLKF